MPASWPTCSPSANDERPIASAPGDDESTATADPRPTLAVWKFASCDGCQLSLLDCEDELLSLGRARSASPTSPRCRGPRSRDPTTCRWWRARSRHRPTPDGSRRSGRASRRLVTIGACATAGGIQGLRNFAASGEYAGHRLRPSRVHHVARHLDPDLRPRRGGLRAPRLPDRPPPAARGDHRHPGRATSGDRRALGVPGVQGARHRLPAREPGDRLPGSGDPDRVRCPVPRRRSGMLRLLRARRHRQHAVTRRRSCAARAWHRSTCHVCSAPSTPARPPSSRSPWPKEAPLPVARGVAVHPTAREEDP